MAANRLYTSLGRLLLVACITVTGLLASEHHGIVKSGGLPVPGATITATQGDKKVVTTSDETGFYSFPDLTDGIWTISVESLGFVKSTKDIGVAADAPSPMWDLKYSTLEAVMAPPAPTTSAPGVAATPAPATATAAAATPPAEKPADTKAATAAAAAPAPTTAAAKPPAKNAKNAKNAKSTATAAATPAAGANGRPSLNQALAAGGGQSGGFTRLGVNQAGDAGAAADATPPQDMADMAAAGNSSFTINGSVSSGLDMPQPGGDWFGGGGGRGGDMGGMMGPGGIPGMGPVGGDQTMAGMGADTGGGRGGRGGAGGGPGGGPGGGGGGFGGGGGRGGGGMAGIPMMPGGGGRGGRGGGAGGPGGRGGRNPASFGNNRRNPRSRYNFALSGNLTQSALNAQTESISGISVKKPSSYNLGTTITAGGPLKIPKIGGTDKGTFTVTYTLGRARLGTSSTNLLMPTDAERAGDFSGYVGSNGLPIQLYDPSGHPYAGNIIPATSINPIAAALLKYYPEPNFTGNTRYNYATSVTSHRSSDNINLRLNYTFNTKNQVNGSLQYQRSSNINPNVFGFVDNGTNNGVNASAGYIYHFTTRLIATTRYSYSKNTVLGTPYFANLTNVEGQLGILGTEQSPQNWGPPSISLSGGGFQGLSDGVESYTHPQTSAVGESLLWVHTTHEFTFGGDYSRRQNNLLQQANPRGTYSFNGSATGLLEANGTVTPGSGLDLADFLLGVPTTSTIAFGNADKYFRSSVYDMFINDQWRISTRLSLQLGVRWDYQAPTTEKYNRIANLDISPDFSKSQAVLPGMNGPVTQMPYSDSLLNSQKTDVSPRIGFAWKPFAKRSTVVRGGWGLGYTPSVYQNLATNSATSLGTQAPFAKSFSLRDSPTCALTLQGGFSTQTLNACNATNQATNTFAVNPNLRIPYSQTWQLAVQQNLKWSLVSTLTYIGTKGTGLTQTFYPNAGPYGGTLAQYPYLANPGGYLYETTNGNSHYNSIQAQLQRRSRAGFSGNLTFAYTKATDDSGLAQNWLNPTAEEAPSSGVTAETLSGMVTYSTGVGSRGGGLINGWKGVLIKDWTINTQVNLGSGQPFTPSTSLLATSLNSTSSRVSIRPDYTGAPFFLNGALNPAAFALPAAGEWGNLGRNSLTGPYTFTMNASANRTFRIGDRKSVTFSLRASNPLNHFVVTNWNSLVSQQNLQFGQPTAYSAPRSVTANVRISF